MKPIELAERLGRWSSGRGPLHVLLAARLRRLIDEGELLPGEPPGQSRPTRARPPVRRCSCTCWSPVTA
jgi:hypothetical protein